MAKNRCVNFSNRLQGLLVLVVILLHSIYSVYCVTTTPLAATSSISSPTTTTESTSPSSASSLSIEITHPSTNSTTILSVLQAIPSTTTSMPTANRPIFLSDDILISESVIMPSIDSEKEAKDLYDKALKQYGSYGASARNICATWEARGCQCSGSVEELALSCRGIGFEEVPLDLPLEIVKL